MSLVKAIQDDFDFATQKQGQEYFNAGRVTIISKTYRKIIARVQGSESYKVSISVSDGEINGHCACPRFQDYGACKHVWATALAIDDLSLFPPLDEDDDYEGDEEILERLAGSLMPSIQRSVPSRTLDIKPVDHARKDLGPEWRKQLISLQRAMRSSAAMKVSQPHSPLGGRRLIYELSQRGHSDPNILQVTLMTQTPLREGEWATPRELRMTQSQIAALPDEQDRLIVQMLAGVNSEYYANHDPYIPSSHALRRSDYPLLLRSICSTGRCFFCDSSGDEEVHHALAWDDGSPWELCLRCALSPGESFYHLEGMLCREEERINCREPLAVLASGIVITQTHIARLEDFGAYPIIEYFRRFVPQLKLPRADADAALGQLLSISPLPKLDLAPELGIQAVSPPMRPRLKISSPSTRASYDRLVGKLSFDYAGRVIPEDAQESAFDPATRKLLKRDAAAEAAAKAKLDGVKFKHQYDYDIQSSARRLTPSKLNKVVLELCAEGWHVEAEGKLYRRGGDFKIDVCSGIDWFELNGSMDFGGISAPLPKLLAALKKGEKTIQLGDGTIGILPDEWLKKYGLLAKVAKATDKQVRFSRGQIGLLDAMLSEIPAENCDEVFNQARRCLRSFEGIAPMDPCDGFKGTLRPYQRQGLGWLNFLNRFGFGGCLADDMGLGKTIQVLSLLHARKGNGKPSLVVVPRSLVFNWIEEAERFAPDLKVMDHSGAGRMRGIEHFAQYNIVLTTYGTLRLDAPILKDVHFDYVILDEAQAIKNGSSESAKAARLMRADHRLAMSGTPVQNHLGELWSLFEFLNPGMLGGASVFKVTGKGNGIDQEGRTLLSRALRPFILRRTKEQVAADLPEKTEQTIHCDMDAEQRKVYDELKEHYRTSLLKRVETDGINKAKIQILEALLRLRQAACHPGLIDETWIDKPAAKLEAMIPQLQEVIEEGHKVLVFSQFTSMLAIVKHHLDKQKIVYEYLDGQTRDRRAKVNRFQNDPDCKLFLISLKAGGLGLNLTAAEYVFLLDPWWNPAIEAQAIDRAHRIGQTRRVFAYRFIANDTVEQKVLELQSRKKDLADMIINADNSLISQLGREDLELLLS